MMTFREALFSRVGGVDQPSLKAVADGAGVSYEQLKKLGQRDAATTNVDDGVKIAAFFGLTLDEFLADSLASDRAAVAQLYSQLSDDERQVLLDAARGRGARGHAALE